MVSRVLTEMSGMKSTVFNQFGVFRMSQVPNLLKDVLGFVGKSWMRNIAEVNIRSGHNGEATPHSQSMFHGR